MYFLISGMEDNSKFFISGKEGNSNFHVMADESEISPYPGVAYLDHLFGIILELR